ncbi:LANO_0F02674g1_1 [Lachancea nothofagi CBS 11611]|uniref:DASH complex subunit DUO1 n=1 Tax=Lachancea nothofagi CBS 11611 TaxID=1266666 RepID=A0A1G4K6Y6_9SACH|nr:LANO_0F02674g1_1 [Lachancea nothofagi CBS 11611]
MEDNTLDNSTINKLIPEIFNQMRSNLSMAPSTKGIKPFVSTKTPSSITTQSLLEESKCLDEILPVIHKLESSLHSAGPQHLRRIKETCESTNKILDTWIRIQSQAGYAYDMMNDSSYLEYITAAQKNDALTPQTYLEQKEAQITDLNHTLDEARRAREVDDLGQVQRETNGKLLVQRGRKPVTASRAPRGGMKKPSGIPRSTSRITKTLAKTGRPGNRNPR